MLSYKVSKFEMSGEKFDYSEMTDKRWNEMRQLMDSADTTFNPGNQVFSHDQFDDSPVCDDQVNNGGSFFNKTAPLNTTRVATINFTDTEQNHLNFHCKVLRNPTVAHGPDVFNFDNQNNLIFDNNGSSRSNTYESLNTNINQEGSYPLICEEWADKPTTSCSYDKLMQNYSQGELPSWLMLVFKLS